MVATTADLQAQKEARKKARMAAKRLPPPTASPSAIQQLDLFRNIPRDALAAIESRAAGHAIERDTLIAKPGAAIADPYLNFIVAGQIGCGEHTEAAEKAVGAKAKAEIFKKVGQTLAVLAAGDFFADDFANKAGTLCLYAITEVQVVRVRASELEPILQAHPALRDRLRNHAEKWLQRIQQIRGESGRDEIFDFYVKNGFSFSTRTKIRQLELCIDCDKCVVACEERHGFARIERFGPQVGLINFSVTCRQCYDPRCLIDCNFDSIARDPISQEIRIDLENCTGCGVCARSCPNDSIFIHDIHGDMDLSLWQDAGKKVPKKVAQKCDRCAGFDDMACISACPTGSMVDAVPELIFGLASEKPMEENCDTRPFEEGWSEHATPRHLPRFLYSTAGLIIVLSALEWAFRKWLPTYAFLPFFREEVTGDAGYDCGRGLGLVFGILGSLCMVGTLFYVIRTRFETKTTFMGGKYLWFAIHNALGVLGPALVFLHGNLLFSKWPSIGVWAMCAVVASGFLGQYLANQLPGKQYRNTKERHNLDKGLLTLSQEWGEHTRSVNMAEVVLQSTQDLVAEKNLADLGTFRFILYLLKDDLRRFMTLQKLRFGPLRQVSNKVLRRQLIQIRKQQLILERQDRIYRTAGQLVSQWKIFHIFFSIGLFLLMCVHVMVVLLF